MLIQRKSRLTGITHEREIAVTSEQLAEWEHGRVLIQQAMPNLSKEDREFIMTGITPEEWDAAFPPEEE